MLDSNPFPRRLHVSVGDDVDKKKPDPKIYNMAAQKLGLNPADCLVVEDSTIGLQAAMGAGMRCIITYTPSTKQQVRLGCCLHISPPLKLEDGN